MIENPAFEAKLTQIENVSPEKGQVIGQYRAVAGKFVELWAEIDQRTEASDWRKDGIGSCRVSPHFFDTHVDGVISGEIEDLWEARFEDHSGDLTGSSCMYHIEAEGCMLNDLKSPRCIAHVNPTHAREIREELGVELPNFKEPLRIIQMGGHVPGSRDFELHPEINEDLVRSTNEATQALIDQIKVLPILHPRT